eukprot:707821-Amphidinium_carterae.1
MSGSRTRRIGVGGGVKRARPPPPVQAVRFSGVWACWSQPPDSNGFVAPSPKWAAGPPTLRTLAVTPPSPLGSEGVNPRRPKFKRSGLLRRSGMGKP